MVDRRCFTLIKSKPVNPCAFRIHHLINCDQQLRDSIQQCSLGKHRSRCVATVPESPQQPCIRGTAGWRHIWSRRLMNEDFPVYNLLAEDLVPDQTDRIKS